MTIECEPSTNESSTEEATRKISRTVQGLYYNWREFGVDLSRIQEAESLKHLDESDDSTSHQHV